MSTFRECNLQLDQRRGRYCPQDAFGNNKLIMLLFGIYFYMYCIELTFGFRCCCKKNIVFCGVDRPHRTSTCDRHKVTTDIIDKIDHPKKKTLVFRSIFRSSCGPYFDDELYSYRQTIMKPYCCIDFAECLKHFLPSFP